VDYTTTTVVVRPGQMNVKSSLPYPQCVFSASRITLPVGVQAVDIFDSKGRLLWGYQRSDGITGSIQIVIPKRIEKMIFIARYN
jgi:hypothetical protein